VDPDGVDLHPRLLEQFVTLAQVRDIDVAAEGLNSTPSALWRSMRRLERQLGTRLFVHDSRVIRLTADGARLVAPAADVLSAAARFTAGVRSINGTLRVAHSSSVDTLSVVLDRYSELHPEVEVEERVLPCDAQLAALREREIDVAVCRVGGAVPEDWRAELLRLDPLLAVVAESAPAASISVDPAHTPTYVGETGGEWLARDDLIAAYERRAGCCLHRVRVLPAAGLHVAALERTHAQAFLMLSSAASLSADRRLAGLVPLQPYFPWSLVWPADSAAAVAAFVEVARAVSRENDWLATDKLPGMPWLPEDDFHRHHRAVARPPEAALPADVTDVRFLSRCSSESPDRVPRRAQHPL
jgi:DNA-binding transcriptional LysR family regulator